MHRNFLLKIFVVLLAALIWLQQALLKKQTEEISFPIQFMDLPENLFLEENPLKTVDVLMEGRGLDFILLKMSDNFAQVDASGYKFGKNRLQIEEKNLRFSDRFNLEIREIDLARNTYVDCDRIITVQKPVEIVYASVADEEFFISNKIVNSNQKVPLTGPSRILESFQTVRTTALTSKMIEEGKLTAELVNPDPRLQLQDKSVVFELAVTKLINKTVTLIPIEYPLDESITIIPQKVTVMIRGPEELVSTINTDSIRAYIDRKDVRKAVNSGENLTEIQFILPSGIRILEHTPQMIQIIKNE